MGLNQTFAYMIKKKVISVFRFETQEENSFGIGVLFKDGSFEKLQLLCDAHGNRLFGRIEYNSEIDGKIVSLAQDREHYRILYVISQSCDGKAKFWGFTEGRLFNFPNVEVTYDTKILPFFSPADNTQVITMHPSENMLRIWEHEVQPDGGIRMKRVKKYDLPDMSQKLGF